MTENAEREALFEIFRRFHGRKTTPEIIRLAVEAGCLELDVEEWRYNKIIKEISEWRKCCRKNKDVQHDLINLREEVLVDGEIQIKPYWKPYAELLVDEHVQHLTKLMGRIRRETTLFFYYFDAIPKGQIRAVQQHLPFEVPARPIELETSEA